MVDTLMGIKRQKSEKLRSKETNRKGQGIKDVAKIRRIKKK